MAEAARTLCTKRLLTVTPAFVCYSLASPPPLLELVTDLQNGTRHPRIHTESGERGAHVHPMHDLVAHPFGGHLTGPADEAGEWLGIVEAGVSTDYSITWLALLHAPPFMALYDLFPPCEQP
jgi:hypothetical protein